MRSALSVLRRRGATTLVLAGLSNGARGAAELAPRIEGLSGLVLLSGASTRVAAPTSYETLVIEGDADSMMPRALVADWAASNQATYVELPGTHFVLLEQRDAIQRALVDYFGRVTRRAADPRGVDAPP